MSNDKETDKLTAEAEALEAMFGSSGWEIAERELKDMVDALRDIRTIPRDGDVVLNLEVRDKTAQAIEEWVDILKSQVNNVTILKDHIKDTKLVERR